MIKAVKQQNIAAIYDSWRETKVFLLTKGNILAKKYAPFQRFILIQSFPKLFVHNKTFHRSFKGR